MQLKKNHIHCLPRKNYIDCISTIVFVVDAGGVLFKLYGKRNAIDKNELENSLILIVRRIYQSSTHVNSKH